MLEPLGDVVDVVLETSHDSRDGRHTDLYRECIDVPVLTSTLYDFEELLLHDGCTGIAVLGAKAPLEVQFDEHKLLVAYGRDLRPFERIMEKCGVIRDQTLKLITEGEHLHSSNDDYRRQFDELCMRLGVWISGDPENDATVF